LRKGGIHSDRLELDDKAVDLTGGRITDRSKIGRGGGVTIEISQAGGQLLRGIRLKVGLIKTRKSQNAKACLGGQEEQDEAVRGSKKDS